MDAHQQMDMIGFPATFNERTPPIGKNLPKGVAPDIEYLRNEGLPAVRGHKDDMQSKRITRENSFTKRSDFSADGILLIQIRTPFRLNLPNKRALDRRQQGFKQLKYHSGSTCIFGRCMRGGSHAMTTVITCTQIPR